MEENQNSTNDIYLSLYDYLGKPAGIDLGTKVYKEACHQNQKVTTREISSKTYTGKVMLYKKDFLEQYFTSSFNNDTFSDDVLDDDRLPF